VTAAAARAAHLIVDGSPVIFTDTLAAALLGDSAEEFIGYHRLHGTHLVLAGARTQVTCRSRYTEDSLARAVGRSSYAALVAPSSAERGEPWLSSFAPEEMTDPARRSGFASVLQVRQRDAIPARLWDRADSLRPADLAVLCHAAV
jgi:hypothetical protein